MESLLNNQSLGGEKDDRKGPAVRASQLRHAGVQGWRAGGQLRARVRQARVRLSRASVQAFELGVEPGGARPAA